MNRTDAAEKAGISRMTLYRKIQNNNETNLELGGKRCLYNAYFASSYRKAGTGPKRKNSYKQWH
ncbi:hypothetical protein CHR53_26025 [Neobacillus mesonae]|uniref:DNA binding HTH domain-containing protein n=1 Tax=Neobacillus mesonae TaxID=1193713 RepID=A0A3T0I530_9BACI|nr:hypothetical protein CHR53_26025 [Neobacillus mesonae]